MVTILRIVLSIALNAIPVGGVVFRDWTPATALTLYWCENLLGSILIALRIAVHRRLTRKRGHDRTQINPAHGRSSADRPGQTFLSEFTTLSLAFSLAHGLFLSLLLALVLKAQPDRVQVFEGLKWMSAALLAGFLLDLLSIRSWPFAELKQRADSMMGRVVLIHLSIMGGMLITAFVTRPQAFFIVFGSLKTLSDLASLVPFQVRPTVEPPRWFLWLTKRFGKGKHWKTGQDAASWWRETTTAELRRIEEDEQVREPASSGPHARPKRSPIDPPSKNQSS